MTDIFFKLLHLPYFSCLPAPHTTVVGSHLYYCRNQTRRRRPTPSSCSKQNLNKITCLVNLRGLLQLPSTRFLGSSRSLIASGTTDSGKYLAVYLNRFPAKQSHILQSNGSWSIVHTNSIFVHRSAYLSALQTLLDPSAWVTRAASFPPDSILQSLKVSLILSNVDQVIPC